MPLNIDSLKVDLCRKMVLITLIEKSQTKARVIATNTAYYSIWCNHNQMQIDVKKQNAVTDRLVSYLSKLVGGINS